MGKKILFINVLYKSGSTGNIVYDLYSAVNENGDTAGVCYGRGKKFCDKNVFKFGYNFETYLHALLTRLTGYTSCFSFFSTIRLLRFIKKFKPDVVHIHELHAYFVNIKPLLKYLKKKQIKTILTLHCEFDYTGKCGYANLCDNWKTQCQKCPNKKEYPKSMFFDHTKYMFRIKKKLFLGFNDLTVVTPSSWLMDRAKQSYLGCYPIKVINNGIDLSLYKPTTSDFRKKYNLEDKIILLGVAFAWDWRKGLDTFIELSKKLDSKYQIFLVGIDENTRKTLPKNIISISRTTNRLELIEIYSASDMFINPTRQDNFPTVNMEALACGIPVITFNTGGSPEIIDESCGFVVEKEDINGLKEKIEFVGENKPFSKLACINRASKFNKKEMYKQYLELY